MKVLVTGGAGFVGANLALRLREELDAEVCVLDNLKRRGSEINLPRLREAGVAFFHGDIRQATDFDDVPGTFDLLLECSAEPSVLAGQTGSPQYLIQTNLFGTVNCLEFARARAGRLLFLSTSRVYALRALQNIRLDEGATRFEIAREQTQDGVSPAGIRETFSAQGARSLYGATKLASELLIEEYAHTYGLKALINRCGVIAGPGQFGKVDQGVFTLWVARHHFGQALTYTGFGGTGKQVRDLLHPSDLFALITAQLGAGDAAWNAEVYNAGGGPAGAVSMREMTDLCRIATGREVAIGTSPTTNPVDIPLYVSDNAKVGAAFGWAPKLGPAEIVRDIAQWIARHEAELRPVFG